MVIYLEKETALNLSEKDIGKLIQRAKINKYDKLQRYYKGEHEILNYKKTDTSSPNNHLVCNMAKHITDTATGYFLGQPVVYSTQNEKLMEALQEIFDENDEQDENIELAKACSIYGHIFEMVYLDEKANINLVRINPKNVVMMYERDNMEPVACIRTIKTYDVNNKTIETGEYWTGEKVVYFKLDKNKAVFYDEKPHYFGEVPFVEYINNSERLGDFEGVISLIDAYNKVQSNTANLFEYNDDALLKIVKMGDVSPQQIKEMKEEGAVLLEEAGEIDWLIKEIQDGALENHKTRLREDIHITSAIPNMTDSNFGNNLSGVAVSYKLWNLEQLCAIKERKFKKGLQRRIRLIHNILNIKADRKDISDVKMTFRRNKPQNLLELAQIVNTLNSELSQQTRLKLLPIIDDVSDEIEKIKKEREDDLNNYDAMDHFLKGLENEDSV